MHGKGIFLHKVPSVLGGDPVALAGFLNRLGITRLDVKVAEAAKPYRLYWPYASWGYNVKPSWVRILRENWQGEIYGWGFAYGWDHKGEGKCLGEQVAALKLDGGIVDAEGKFERQPSPAMRAQDLLRAYRSQTAMPVGWCSWALFKSATGATWHNAEVARAAMRLADFGMPMVYWWGSTAANARWWLTESLRQWRLLTNKPIIPTGRVYTGDGGVATPDGVKAFGMLARASGVPGESWWHLLSLMGRPELQAALESLPPFAS